jgi:hypothetical protein
MTGKSKVYITGRMNLDISMFNARNGIDIVSDKNDADIIISQSSIKYPELLHKTIYIAYEPPISNHRQWCYNNFDKMLLVVAYDPDISKENQISFCTDDAFQWYPTYADPYEYITREITTINKRGVFFAGNILRPENSFSESLPSGYKNICHLRKIMGTYFLQHHEGSQIIGLGWNNQQSKSDYWRKEKTELLKNPNIDFILALENTIQPNYITEKIWDGIASDKVTLYLGDPRIENHIPTNCFVDLRPYYDNSTGNINMDALSNRLKTMTQDEYDSILINARQFRKLAHGNYRKYCKDLTSRLIKFIKFYKSNKA